MNWNDGLVRGKVVEEFTFKSLCQVIECMVDHWMSNREQLQAVIGYDTRFQADQSARLCAELLAAKGIKIQLDKVPIPLGAILLAVQKKKAFGILVTGGDGAVEYTGVRMIHQHGVELRKEEWDQWRQRFKDDAKITRLDFGEAMSSGVISFSPLLDDYLGFLRTLIDCEGLKRSGLRVVFDSLYGSAQGVFKHLLYSEDMREIHDARHSMFGGLVPALKVENVQRLIYILRENGMHLGILYDPEGRNWALVNGRTGSAKESQVLITLIEKRAKSKNLDTVFPHWRKDGILCSLLFLESILDL